MNTKLYMHDPDKAPCTVEALAAVFKATFTDEQLTALDGLRCGDQIELKHGPGHYDYHTALCMGTERHVKVLNILQTYGIDAESGSLYALARELIQELDHDAEVQQ